jgi:DNA-binding NtrC family response regulator
MARILVVEDETVVRKLLCHLLKMQGLEAVGVDSVPDAKALIEAEDFALIIADYSLGDQTAEDLYSWVKEKHSELTNQFILTTGWPFLEGFPVVLQKPFQLTEFEELVQKMLDLPVDQ